MTLQDYLIPEFGVVLASFIYWGVLILAPTAVVAYFAWIFLYSEAREAE